MKGTARLNTVKQNVCFKQSPTGLEKEEFTVDQETSRP